MKYFHKASNTQIRNLFQDKVTYHQLMTLYREPEWCGYGREALNGVLGCWSLMDINDRRKKISPNFCKECDCYIPKNKKL